LANKAALFVIDVQKGSVDGFKDDWSDDCL